MDKYKITFETWNKVADLYQEKFMDLDLYNDSYDVFCQLIQKEKASILEMGCGPGNITNYLFNKRTDFDILATDVAPNMIQLAQKNVPKANFKVMDCRAINTLSQYFDGIICGFCLPYLSKEDVHQLIINAYNLLNDTGIFYISFIEGSYKQSGFEKGSTGDSTFVYYYNNDDLQKELKQHRFKIKHLIQKHYNKNDNTQQTHSIIIAQK